MNQEMKTIVKKTTKVACVTCIALGGAALIASGAALKALAEGGKYLRDTVKKIIDEEPETEEVIVDIVTEDAPAAEAVAEEADSAEPEPQEA